MDNFDKQMQELYDFYGVSNDNQLSKAMGYSNNSVISEWRKHQRIPAKHLLKLSINGKNAVVFGNNGIAVNGKNNQVGSLSPKFNTPEFKKFCELFDKYGNDDLLTFIIKKLKEIEKISKSGTI